MTDPRPTEHEVEFSRASELIPFCPRCKAFSVPTESEKCGECGNRIVYRIDR